MEDTGKEEVVTVFWNVENFFDWTDQGKGESDAEFSSGGARRWTASRFYRKCDAIAKTLMWIGNEYGRMPDVVGFAEVENRSVLERMLEYTLLRKFGYDIIHVESCDRRGIDVALMYRKSSMRLVSYSSRTPHLDGSVLATRNILQVRLSSSQGTVMDFVVNHHPSRYGGEKSSSKRRQAAMNALRELCDSLVSIGGAEGIVAMGDFNDTPSSPHFSSLDTLLTNLGTADHEAGRGTIRYEGRWETIDMFLVSRNLDKVESRIQYIPFLMTRDRRFAGEKPLRTYSGPKYMGGVSDHCPVVLRIVFE